MATAEASSQVPTLGTCRIPRPKDSITSGSRNPRTQRGWEVILPPHQIPQHRIVTVNKEDCLLQQFRGQDGIDPTLPPMVNPRNPQDSQAKGFQRSSQARTAISFYRKRLVSSGVGLPHLHGSPPLYHINSQLEGVCLHQADSPQAIQLAI